MNATIIGANGYIARNLIYTLNKSKIAEKLYLYDKDNSHRDDAKIYEHMDILSLEDVAKINFNVDVVFMFVGKTGTLSGFSNPDVFLDINEKALLHVLNEYVAQNSRAKLIFPSTRLLYNNNNNAAEEDISSEFNTIYAVNKMACEKYITMYHNVFNINYIIARIGIPYGTLVPETSSYGTIEFMFSKAEKGENISLYGDGNPRRTITYIGDLCETLISIAKNSNCINEIYNIGGENYSLLEMANLIAVSKGVNVDFVKYPELALKIESGDTVFNDTKLKSLIGNHYKTKFKDWVTKHNESF